MTTNVASSRHGDLFFLFAFGLICRLATALPMQTPGYMDAYYYFANAQRIAAGHGLTEPFIWNYLQEPLQLPMPAFGYWMPLSSMLMVPFFGLFGANLRAAQIPFILLAALLPLTAYIASERITLSRRRAQLAGVLTALSPFYVKFWVTTGTATPFAVLGAAALLIGASACERDNKFAFVATGLLIGLAHLTRADAPLLFIALIAAGSARWKKSETRRGLVLILTAYLLTLAPWTIYTMTAQGRLPTAGGLSTLFLRSYDDLYAYDRKADLTNYLEWGIGSIARSKLEAAGANFLTLIGVVMGFILAPFAIWEVWNRRRECLARVVGAYTMLLYIVMTFFFTFPGTRGSMLHSSSALVPLLTPFGVHGLARGVEWVARWRSSWNPTQAKFVFGVGLAGLFALLGAFLHLQALVGTRDRPGWNAEYDHYRQLGDWLDRQGLPPERPVLVGNPPAFYYYTGRFSIVIPNESAETVAAICRRFGAAYVILDLDHPIPLDELYREHKGLAGLEPIAVPDIPKVKVFTCPS